MRQPDAPVRPSPLGRAPRRGFALLRAGLVASLVAGLLVGAWPAEAQTSGPSHGARPAHFGDAELPVAHFAHALEADTTISDAVEIFNFTSEPTTFDVYAADMQATADGGLRAAARDEQIVGAGAWITPERATVEVGPRSSELVDFAIDVPRGAVPGEHHAALLVERHQPASREAITTRSRIALQVDLEVLGEIDLGVTLGPLERRHAAGELQLRRR